MSDAAKKKNRPTDQPMPVGGQECVQDALVAEILERKAIGVQTYGTPLMTFNGRDPFRDTREELLDGAVYLKQASMQYDVMGRALQRIDDTLALACQNPEPATEAEHGYYAAMSLIRTARDPKSNPAPTDIEDHLKAQLLDVFTQGPSRGEDFIQALYTQVLAPLVATMEILQAQVIRNCENQVPADVKACSGCASPDVVYENFQGTRLCGSCAMSELPK